MPRITPNLWFDTEGREAAEFYVSVFPNSRITNVTYYGEAGPRPSGTVMTVDFVLDGHEFTGINGGPHFTFDEAVSFLVNCKDQQEIDYYWDTLINDGGEPSQCGWLKDKFGLSWQIVPGEFLEMVANGNREQVERVMAAIQTMRKLDLAALRCAYAG